MEPTFANIEKRLDGSEEEHAHHHNREYGDGIASHVHDEQIHRNLLGRCQGYVPRSFHNQVAINLMSNIAMRITQRWIISWWIGQINLAAPKTISKH